MAYYLAKNKFAKVTLYEREKTLGGLVQTNTCGPFFFEKGPRTFAYARSANLLALIDELGLTSDLIFAKPQKRYVLYNNQLKTLQSMAAKAVGFGALRDLYTPAYDGDETVHSFAKRRFGSWVADNLIDPMTLGIFAAPAEKLSVNACFPTLKEREKNGSLLKQLLRQKSDPRLFTLKSGMSTLIDALTRQGNFEIIQKNITDLDLPADKIYSTLPAHQMAKITNDSEFKKITYNNLTVVHLGYQQNILKKQGFGYLIPSHQNSGVLGVVFDSCVFPEQNKTPNQTRLTVMLKSSYLAEKQSLKAISEHLNIDTVPDQITLSHYPQAIPQMGLGHDALVKNLCQKHPQITLMGSYITGPAVNNCVSIPKQGFAKYL